MEAPLLETSSGDVHLIGDDGDYLPVKGLKAWWRVFCVESAKLWRIGGPIAFQILSSKVSVLAWIALSALASQILLCWLFVYVFGWGTTGVAIAFDITNWGMAIAQFVYVVGWCKDGWKGFSSAAFREIWVFVKLSFASAIMICLEIWYMMSIIILTGHLDNSVTAVGSLSICMNVDSWETMVFIGFNAAISVRVSNELGMGHPRAARYSVYVTLFQSLLMGILFMIVVLATRNHFSIIFTNSETMQRAVAHLSGLLGITMLLNSVQPVISGN
ncbi:protein DETOXIFICATION 35 [Sesamum alatum]|uniref:Protein DETOXIFICATION 35 n=1 Tax=Sesamum alatum TaxID=300844 RepID=A0AAE2CR65_9LAMI|nr:protein DETOXIFICATION 35 [Sesamum alatum]